MILHLLEDEKFINHVIEMFEYVYPQKNIYYIQPTQKDGKLKYLTINNPNIISCSIQSERFVHLINNLKNFEAVILHNLINPYKIEIVKNASQEINFHWMCWGADLYRIPELSKKLFLRETKKIYRRAFNRKGKIGLWLYENFYIIYTYLYKIKFKKNHESLEYKRLFTKIKSVSTVIPTEFQLIQKYLNKNIEYIPFKYGTIEGSLKNNLSTICSKNNFLVGNSAYLTNNHIDTFKILKKVPLNENFIYLPLSYGNKEYAQLVEHIGKKLFKSRVIGIHDFLPVEDYNKILNTCGNVIMNHTRQQGMGNIKMALWKGARVFLNPKNPIYSFLKNEGFIIFNINEIKNYQSLPSFDLLAAHNRPLLKKIYAKKIVLEKTEQLVKYLTKPPSTTAPFLK